MMDEIEIPGPRREIRGYLRHVRRSYYRGMRWQYTGSCLTAWARRLGEQTASILRGQGRARFVFCIADSRAAIYCHKER